MRLTRMSRTYDLNTPSGVFRAIAKAKNIHWSAASTVDGKKSAPLASLKNPQSSKLSFVARVLGVNVSDVFLILENPARFDSIILGVTPRVTELDQEDGGEPVVVTEDGGTPITGEDGGTPVTP